MIKEELDSDKVFVLHKFLTSDECVALIRLSEGLTYEIGTVGGVVAEGIRNNERLLVNDKSLADTLFCRAAHGYHRWPKVVAWSGSTNVGDFTAIAQDRPSSLIGMDRTCRLKPTRRVR